MNDATTLLATFGYSIASAIIPVFNSEIYLLGVSALARPGLMPAVVVVASLGQMIGKAAMYHAGRGALRIRSRRLHEAVAAVEARYRERHALGDALIFASSVVGIPPFYLISVACGLFEVPFVRFFAIGLAGRLIRFTLIVAAPQLVRWWVG